MLGYENGKNEYDIPVEWRVYDTIKVQADSFDEAYHWAVANADYIPLGTEPEYVGGSYVIGRYKLAKEMNRGCVS